ncbi:acetyl-CoA hydrolase/transferase family protein [Dictyobacter kobayashii]|uniref:4-hydroxybutyrate CoA-transferase n=1 Tax=Dictyobacter kobayashii TaxID=2014872 RepID=A0A402AUL1_9CHLR|nr:acetyl-CoA hydrolase/transferase C-terminal domain-containing protein [Dictyobacter kobayashii]GCE22808.1 4-hydroxybutyrate CoA-transferase [Dictyobacter kobayashii]
MTTWCDAATAVRAVSSGDRVFIHGACMTPTPLINALVARGLELQDVELTHLHTYGPAPYTDEKWRGHFSTRALFVGENLRQAANNGRASYTPVFLSDIPALFEPTGSLPIDVAFVQVSPPDMHGYCSLGASVDVARAAVDFARQVVALVNPQVPRTHGNSFVHISKINYAVKCDEPLYEVARRQPDEIQMQVGRYVASLIEDGATLQLGIGAIPDAVLQALSDRRALGVHTEMFSDGILDLVEQGVITGENKIMDRGKIVASFVVGSRRLLDFIADNPTVEMRPSDYTNSTANIRQFEHMVTINSAIQVDLTGQVCAESIGTRFYSGVGGQMDFMRGAALSRRGRPIIALPATARVPRGDELTAAVLDTLPGLLKPVNNVASRIVPILTPGAAVTTSRAHVHYVATEYGVAVLHGRDLAERARSLIAIAAPQFREELERAAYNLHLLA